MRNLEGNIGPLTIPMIIQEVSAQGGTGTLRLEHPGGTAKTLYLEKGRVVFASSNDPDDRLGALLLRHGMVSRNAVDDAAARCSREKKRMGTVLVEAGLLRPRDLVWGVTEQVKEMVLGIFDWTTGHHEYEEGHLPGSEVIQLKMSSDDLVLSGIKSIRSWTRIAAAVGGSSTVYGGGPRADDLAEKLPLSLDEWSVLCLGSPGVTLEELCEASPVSDFETCRLVWAFTVVGILARQEGMVQGTAG